MDPLKFSEKRFEKINTQVYEDALTASREVAEKIKNLILERQKSGKEVVLGLATGSTPTMLYEELVRFHQEEGLSFKNVVTFNLDEYYPMEPTALQSYVRFMNENLFDHIDIPRQNIHIPDGTLPLEKIPEFCHQFEQSIEEHGGIDIQILGIGRSGHIGFNEPGSTAETPTRLITLDQITRTDAASDFFGEEFVPRRAITMGVGTILKAKAIYLMAWGEGKAPIIQKTVEGPVSDLVPATFLQEHNDATIILDKASAAELTRAKTPWLVRPCKWDEKLTRSAVVWLCRKLEKPILKLRPEDYNEHGMSDLITDHGPAYDVNIRVFNQLQHTITGWPGGKPNADDSQRPERATPFPKRVVIFSPHPDDDVISMGGTLIRLVDQGHEVHVAYQTSGNIAVFDDDAIKFAGFAKDMAKVMDLDHNKLDKFYQEMVDFIENKSPGEVDSQKVQEIKGLIRRGEAESACRYSGIAEENIHFLDMPFYETGKVRKNPISTQDVKLISDLLEKVQPHQIYAAGDLSDPHGTHRVCLNAIFQAMEQLKKQSWTQDCYMWLYRGAWQEWGVDKVEMAVPISPGELDRKRRAIFKHQSQKDRPLFPGADPREFWQRSEDRNRATAQIYDALGMAEYEAMEGFVRYKF